eukprot:1121207-Amphidinium_carterae.1
MAHAILLAELEETAFRLAPSLRNGFRPGKLPTKELAQLRGKVLSLPLPTLSPPELSKVLLSCGRIQIRDHLLWEAASKYLAPILTAASPENALITITSAYSHAGIWDPTVLRCIVPLTIQKARGGDFELSSWAAAKLARNLGSIYASGTKKPKQAQRQLAVPAPTEVGQLLEARLVKGVDELSAFLIAEALKGLSQLESDATALLSAVPKRLVTLAQKKEVHTKSASMLILAFARLKRRDPQVLQVMLDVMVEESARGNLVPKAALPSLVQA